MTLNRSFTFFYLFFQRILKCFKYFFNLRKNRRTFYPKIWSEITSMIRVFEILVTKTRKINLSKTSVFSIYYETLYQFANNVRKTYNVLYSKDSFYCSSFYISSVKVFECKDIIKCHFERFFLNKGFLESFNVLEWINQRI